MKNPAKGPLVQRIALGITLLAAPTLALGNDLLDESFSAVGGQTGAFFGYSVSTAGDVNGDGYSDLIVGARAFDGTVADEGAAYLYLGGPGGLAATPAWSAFGAQAGAQFGHSVATAGDVDGDGFDDVLVGANLYDGTLQDEGAAFLYRGTPTGLESVASWTVFGGQSGCELGYSVAWAGDVNGDGFDDVAIGARLFDDTQVDEGQVAVYLGSAAGLAIAPAHVHVGGQAGAEFGWSVATAGDVDADGLDDVIVGARNYDGTHVDGGAAFVYAGGAGSPVWTKLGGSAGARLGWSVRTAGDTNGDGYSDVIVGAPFQDTLVDEGGAAYVYFGSASGLASSPALEQRGEEPFGHLGWSVSAAGDLDGDGLADVAIGERHADGSGFADEGRVVVRLGIPYFNLASSPLLDLFGGQPNPAFGWSVAPAGDVDGDGRGDLAVGAHRFDGTQVDEGLVRVFAGGSSLRVRRWAERGLLTVQFMDTSAASHTANAIGDVDGDGCDEVSTTYVPLIGGVSVTTITSRAGPNTSVTWTQSGVTGAQDAGDLNGDGYEDVIAQAQSGEARIYAGSPSGLPDLPTWIVGNDVLLGAVQDFDGDGFADLVAQNLGESRLRLLRGSSTGLSRGWEILLPSAFYSYCSTDVDGDGLVDFVLSTADSISVYRGNPTALLIPPAGTVPGGVVVRCAGDVNGDGLGDVVAGSEPATLYVGGSDGTLVLAGVVEEPFSPSGDTDGDGHSDGTFSLPDTFGYTRLFSLPGGDSGFGPAFATETTTLTFYNPGFDFTYVSGSPRPARDLNGDGVLDFLYTSYSAQEGSAFGDPTTVTYSSTAVFTDSGPFQHYAGTEAPWRVVPRRSDDASPIPFRSTEITNAGVLMRAESGRPAKSAAGRASVRLVAEFAPQGAPFDGALAFASPAVDGGAPGSLPVLEVDAALAPNDAYKWRARIETDNPYFPHGRWISEARNGIHEWDFRLATSGPSEPGSAVCFGDGTSAPCPCGNESPTTGEGCLHSGGVGMRIIGTGTASLAADDLVLQASNVPIGNTGIYYCGMTPVQNPLFDGIQCTAGNVVRFQGQLATTTTVTDSGFVAQTPFPGFWFAGTTYTFQYFTRDNQAGPTPCGGFANLSPGYSVTMAP